MGCEASMTFVLTAGSSCSCSSASSSGASSAPSSSSSSSSPLAVPVVLGFLGAEASSSSSLRFLGGGTSYTNQMVARQDNSKNSSLPSSPSSSPSPSSSSSSSSPSSSSSSSSESSYLVCGQFGATSLKFRCSNREEVRTASTNQRERNTKTWIMVRAQAAEAEEER